MLETIIMPKEKIYIKNMVCPRCIMVVEQELDKLQIPFDKVELGEVELLKNLTDSQNEAFKTALQKVGFAIVDDKKAQLIEKTKTLLIDLIQNKENNINTNYSDYLTSQLKVEYIHLSSLFSSIENTTIEKYIISLKIDKVKEWLIYHDLTLSQIAFRLNYSSVAALSNQFKKVTGLTPSYFKSLKLQKREIAL